MFSDDNSDNYPIKDKLYNIETFIDKICEPRDVYPHRGAKVIINIPTKSGYHLITTPFNLQQFKEEYPDIDVHKNNPTLLYCL